MPEAGARCSGELPLALGAGASLGAGLGVKPGEGGGLASHRGEVPEVLRGESAEKEDTTEGKR